MKIRQRQAGMSIPGMLVIAIMVGFFVMCAIRMTPIYLEYLTVKRIMEDVSSEFKPEEDTIADMQDNHRFQLRSPVPRYGYYRRGHAF